MSGESTGFPTGAEQAGQPLDLSDGQGEQAQGTTQDTGGLFDSYLQNVPEDGREQVAAYLKDAEKNVNERLQSATEYEKQFGPYKDIDLSRVKPEDLSQVLDWYSTVGQSPEAYQNWLKEAATEAGLIQAQEQQEQAPAEDQDIDAYIQSRIDRALVPFQEKATQQEQAEKERAMEQHIDSTLARIEADNKLTLSDEQKEAVLALGGQVETDDWVEKGFAKFQALTGAAQADLVKDKTAQPTPGLPTGGQPAPARPRSFGDASLREQALERFSQAL